MPRHEKTEKPTPRRKREARKEGQIAKTPELAGWLGTLVAASLLPTIVRNDGNRLTELFTQVSQVASKPSTSSALKVFEGGLSDAAILMLPVLGMIMLIALVATVGQVGFVVATKAAKPKLSRLSPIAGIRRLFSAKTSWDLAKQLLKLCVILLVAGRAVYGLADHVIRSQPVATGAIVSYAATTLLGMVRSIALIGLLLAVADYAFQRRRISQSLKMTKHEVKDDLRKQEGDPLLRRAIRRKQASMSRLRMMAAIAGADVVVTNPTHYAVALRYDPQRGHAPRVVAKGMDHVALRIREEAKNHHVAIVEDPPLARAVYQACEIDQLIPHELYFAVARLLAFVFTLPPVVRRSGITQRRPVSALIA